MWADNYWPFSDDKEKLVCMVNDIIEEMLVLDMEPQAGVVMVGGQELLLEPSYLRFKNVSEIMRLSGTPQHTHATPCRGCYTQHILKNAAHAPQRTHHTTCHTRTTHTHPRPGARFNWR